MEVIACNVKLKVGKVYDCEHKDTEAPGKFKVLKEATKEEYTKQHIQEHKFLGNYYWVSLD